MKMVFRLLILIVFSQYSYGQLNYTIETVKQDGIPWQFRQLKVFDSENETIVSGRLTASTRFGLPHGHVDIAVYSKTGERLVETTTNYVPSILTAQKKRKGGLRFSKKLEIKMPEDALIKIAFHKNEPRPPTSPPHAHTVAQ